MENLSSRELELVVGAVKMQIATMKTLWKGGRVAGCGW